MKDAKTLVLEEIDEWKKLPSHKVFKELQPGNRLDEMLTECLTDVANLINPGTILNDEQATVLKKYLRGAYNPASPHAVILIATFINTCRPAQPVS